MYTVKTYVRDSKIARMFGIKRAKYWSDMRPPLVKVNAVLMNVFNSLRFAMRWLRPALVRGASVSSLPFTTWPPALSAAFNWLKGEST